MAATTAMAMIHQRTPMVASVAQSLRVFRIPGDIFRVNPRDREPCPTVHPWSRSNGRRAANGNAGSTDHRPGSSLGQRRKIRVKSDRQPRSERSRRDAREASLARFSCSTSSILSRVRSVISSLRSGVGVERIGPPRESSTTRAATRKEIITQLRIVGCEPVNNAVGSTARGTV